MKYKDEASYDECWKKNQHNEEENIIFHSQHELASHSKNIVTSYKAALVHSQTQRQEIWAVS